MASLPEFMHYVYKILCSITSGDIDERNKIQIVKLLHKTTNEINTSKYKSISPTEFTKKIHNEFSFADEQQDSYELYHRIIEVVDSYHTEDNPLSIKIKNIYECCACKTVNFNFIEGFRKY